MWCHSGGHDCVLRGSPQGGLELYNEHSFQPSSPGRTQSTHSLSKKKHPLVLPRRKKSQNRPIFSNHPKKKMAEKIRKLFVLAIWWPLESVLSIVLAISKEPSSLPPAIYQVLLWNFSVIKMLDCIPRGIGYSMLCKTIKRTYQGQYTVIFMHIHKNEHQNEQFLWVLLQFHKKVASLVGSGGIHGPPTSSSSTNRACTDAVFHLHHLNGDVQHVGGQ